MSKSEKFWDRQAKTYHNLVEPKNLKYNLAVEKTKDYLDRKHMVLDLACGSGIIANELAKDVKEVHGIDISLKMIEYARKNTALLKIENVTYSHGNISTIDFDNESFDIITAYNILHLLEDVQHVFNNVYSLLKPGGLFISETPCLGEKKSFFGYFLKFLSKLKLVPYVNRLCFSDLESNILDSNFAILVSEDLEKKRMNYFIVAQKPIDK